MQFSLTRMKHYNRINMKKYHVIGRCGGPGTFWEGFEYELGSYRFYWQAWLKGNWHVNANPMRLARIEYK